MNEAENVLLDIGLTESLLCNFVIFASDKPVDLFLAQKFKFKFKNFTTK